MGVVINPESDLKSVRSKHDKGLFNLSCLNKDDYFESVSPTVKKTNSVIEIIHDSDYPSHSTSNVPLQMNKPPKILRKSREM